MKLSCLRWRSLCLAVFLSAAFLASSSVEAQYGWGQDASIGGPSQFNGPVIANDYLEAQTRSFFGYHYFDLPTGAATDAEQAELRYLMIRNYHYDPELCNLLSANFASAMGGLDPNNSANVAAGTANAAAFNYLNSLGGANGSALYESMTPYEQSVFLVAMSAAVAAGVNVTGATFVDFYYGDGSSRPFGITLSGVTPGSDGNYGTLVPFFGSYRSPSSVGIGAVELTDHHDGTVSIDVDIVNPNSALAIGHVLEVFQNSVTGFTTHPIDAARALHARGVPTGLTNIGCS